MSHRIVPETFCVSVVIVMVLLVPGSMSSSGPFFSFD
jgi:hypothetical protein